MQVNYIYSFRCSDVRLRGAECHFKCHKSTVDSLFQFFFIRRSKLYFDWIWQEELKRFAP